MVRLRALEVGQEKAHAQRTQLADTLLSSLSETREAVNTIKAKFGNIDSNFREKREVTVRRDVMIGGVDDGDAHGDPQGATSHGLARKSAGSYLRSEELEVLTNNVSKLSLLEKVFMREEAILSGLSFDKRGFRHDHIPLAHRQTFEWILNKTAAARSGVTGQFARWLESGSGAFWITGKPGSGKSTLMKLIAKHVSMGGLLDEWAGPKKLVFACHFFWSAGTAIQRSQEGLLRTVLFDIFSQAPELIQQLCPVRWDDATWERRQRPWSVSELSSVLHKVTSLPSLPIKIFLLVDGLDEFDGVQDSLCREMIQLAALPDVKLCLASRPWNVFEDYFGLNKEQRTAIHELTRDDIAYYVKDKLQQHPRWGLVTAVGSLANDATKLIDETTDRANGVFLWVHLVTTMLYDGLTNDDSVADLWRRLESIPTDLSQFFRHILEAVEPFYHQKMAGALLMTLAAPGPLPVEVYCFHDMEYTDIKFALKQPIRPMGKNEMQTLRDPMARRLNAWCKGLLEVWDGRVEFLHRSVRDFLLTESEKQFLKDQTGEHFDVNLSPFRAYVAWIKSSKFSNVSNERLLRRDDRWETQRRWGDVFRNTMGRALFFARTAIDGGEHCRSRCFELLDDLEFAVEVMALNDQLTGISAFTEGSLDNRHRRARSLFREMLVLHDFGDYIATRMGENPRYFDDVQEPPLWIAVQTLVTEVIDFHQDGSNRPDAPKSPPTCVTVVEYLLQQGCNPNEASMPLYHPGSLNPNATPWTELLSRLLGDWNNGLGRSGSGGITLSPHLQEAVLHVLKSGVIELLLASGADGNAKIWTGGGGVSHAPLPTTISAAALFVLIPLLLHADHDLPKSYFHCLRILLASTDFVILEASLFHGSRDNKGILCLVLLTPESMQLDGELDPGKLQRCAKTLCEVANFDKHGLPWHKLEDALKVIFPKNLLEQIQDAVASRGSQSIESSQGSPGGSTVDGKRKAGPGELGPALPKRANIRGVVSRQFLSPD